MLEDQEANAWGPRGKCFGTERIRGQPCCRNIASLILIHVHFAAPFSKEKFNLAMLTIAALAPHGGLVSCLGQHLPLSAHFECCDYGPLGLCVNIILIIIIVIFLLLCRGPMKQLQCYYLSNGTINLIFRSTIELKKLLLDRSVNLSSVFIA